MTAGRKNNSDNKDWCTPPKYVKAIKRVFRGKIDFDPCSSEYSVVNAEVEYQLPEHDGLKESWNYPTIFVNPPYGKDKKRNTGIKDWLKRCAEANREHGSEVIALVPVATNTNHWKQNVFTKASAVCFLYDTRLKFLEKGKPSKKGAPMSCAMIYWGESYEEFFKVFMEFGAVADIRNLKGEVIGPNRKFKQTKLY